MTEREKHYQRIHDLCIRHGGIQNPATDELHRNVASRRLNAAAQACQDHKAKAAYRAMLISTK